MSVEKAQAFAHRVVEFADYEQCVKFFLEKDIDFDRPNDMGWTVLMSVCACGELLLLLLLRFFLDAVVHVCFLRGGWTSSA